MPFPGQPGGGGGKVPSFVDSLRKLMQGIAEAKMAPDADQGLLQAIEQAILQAVQQRAAQAQAPPPGLTGAFGGAMPPLAGTAGPPGAPGAAAPPGVGALPPNLDVSRLLAGTA